MKKDDIKFQLFQELCHSYSKDLQNFIYTLTRKDHYAMEEIFQNTMVQALKGLHTLRQNEKMKSWLFSIAKTEAMRYYSKITSSNHIESWDLIEMDWEDPIEYEDFTEAVEDKVFVLSFINQLSEEEHQIFVLHYAFDMTLKEISDILNINNNTVRTIHHRGIQKCREIISERGQAYEQSEA